MKRRLANREGAKPLEVCAVPSLSWHGGNAGAPSARRSRLAPLPWTLACLACLAVGCAVPEIELDPDDATTDATTAPDGGNADVFVPADAAADVTNAPDAPADVAPIYDGHAYCTPDAPSAPMGLSCCGDSGVVCSGGCSTKACAACAGCELPNICCSQGAKGTCKPQCQ